jgi:hypothetical protein
MTFIIYNEQYKVKMYNNKYAFVVSLLCLFAVFVIISLQHISGLITIEIVSAQVKGGLSAGSVNPNSNISGERIGNTTEDLMTGGTSTTSVTGGLTMTMSSSERTGNTTNFTSTEGGLSASSVNKAGEK